MNKKTVLITGGNAGIGFATARVLAKEGAQVLLACRNQDKAIAAAKFIRQETPDAFVEVLSLDLSSLAEIKKSAERIKTLYPSIDVLINNAGVYCPTQQFTVDGYELQFGVNYLGHFLLTHLLLSSLKHSGQARIINVASIGHWMGCIRPKSFKGWKQYNSFMAYGQSKLANILFSHVMSRRLAQDGIISNAIHPGGIDSDLYRQLPNWLYAVFRLFLIGTERPARMIAEMALSEQWQSKTGKYVSAHMPDWQSVEAKNVLAADCLYKRSVELVEDYL